MKINHTYKYKNANISGKYIVFKFIIENVNFMFSASKTNKQNETVFVNIKYS